MGNCTSKKKPRLTDVEYKDTVPFVPPVTGGRVVKVYDGDTITIATTLPFKEANPTVYRFSVRLRGIDTPEMRTKSEEEKAVARLARQALADLCLGRTVTLTEVALEKYGRLLANISLPVEGQPLQLNKWMVDQRYAVSYGGGTKQCPVSWKRFHETGAMD